MRYKQLTMSLTRNQLIIIGIAGLIAFFFILVLLGVIPGLRQTPAGGEEIKMVFWGIEDERVMRRLIDDYAANFRNVKIDYSQFSEENYESQLLNALASGQGPDIFMIRSGWLGKHFDKIAPLAEEQFSFSRLGQIFPKVIEQDFSADGVIYALPLYIDTLAFIYNKDYFDAKGIAVVPKTWSEFQKIVPRLKETDLSGRLVKSAAAIGGSGKSVDSAADLLNLLMLQFGAEMVDSRSGQANFSRIGGSAALDFYLQFSNPSNAYYTWNDNLRPSLDGFGNETIGAIFNYSSALKAISAKNPFLEIGVSPTLQFDLQKPVNYADYWGLSVWNQSKNSAWAWHFIASIAADESVAENYLQLANRPPALRSLIQKYSNDPNLGVFARQSLTARSWFQPDSEQVKKIFSEMIEAVLNSRLSTQRALEEAENKINNLIK